MREKREHQRAVLSTKVQVSVKDGNAWEVISIDISLGGMFLGPSPMAVIGQEVVVEFELAKLGLVKMPGFVRWIAPRGFGIQFGLLGPRETHAIGGLVRKQASS